MQQSSVEKETSQLLSKLTTLTHDDQLSFLRTIPYNERRTLLNAIHLKTNKANQANHAKFKTIIPMLRESLSQDDQMAQHLKVEIDTIWQLLAQYHVPDTDIIPALIYSLGDLPSDRLKVILDRAHLIHPALDSQTQQRFELLQKAFEASHTLHTVSLYHHLRLIAFLITIAALVTITLMYFQSHVPVAR